ncbi:hypothetical protein BKA66DRAFT_448060 [Pyrenochaeta sp. MPI-SDFR-AT-0127]|nr:hypothetical protein BKA66DRAFT_448060 [Pyrenochaeta sp. MPI-SDFR-AT-0127]
MTDQSLPMLNHLSIRRIKVFFLPFSCGMVFGIFAAFDLLTGAPGSQIQFATVAEATHSRVNAMIAGEPNGLVPVPSHRGIQFWNDSSFVLTFDIIYANITYDEAKDIIEPT